MPELKKLIVILGPTASGKTALGIELAKNEVGAVVSADSRQVYAGMDIGTGKPKFDDTSPEMVQGVEHYLFNIRTPDQQLTLAEWQHCAFEVIDKVFSSGRTPYLVGGTMLYIDSIIFNYDIPAIKPNRRLRIKWEGLRSDVLYSRLIKMDPKAAHFIEPENKRRIIRALEVMDKTGKRWSESRNRRKAKYPYRLIGIFPGWEVLRQRIEERAGNMLTKGLLEETKGLREKYGSIPLLETINYKQAGLVIAGKLSPEEARFEMGRAMYRYARRQMSWWRRNKRIEWYVSPNAYSFIN